jgi:hypothetical protein
MSFLSDPEVVGRFLVTAFFAVVFLQSAADKLLDPDGNVSYFREHFAKSPIPPGAVPLLFWVLTFVESAAGILCGIGILLGDFARPGMGAAAWGVTTAGLALLGLLTGQRLARDYAGAAVIAAYFVVALVGISLF